MRFYADGTWAEIHDDVDGGPSIRDMRATSRWFSQAKRVDAVRADDSLLRHLLGEDPT